MSELTQADDRLDCHSSCGAITGQSFCSDDDYVSLDREWDCVEDQSLLKMDTDAPFPSSTSHSLEAVFAKLNQSLYANQPSCTDLDLTVPIPYSQHGDIFLHLLYGIRHNTHMKSCRLSNAFFQSLSLEQKRALVDAICDMPSLRYLEMDAVFPSFIHIFNCWRHWKRDLHYQHTGKLCNFVNNAITEINLTGIPSHVSESYLGNLVMMTLSSFASLQSLTMCFLGPATPSSENLLRLALVALGNTKLLGVVKFGLQDETESSVIIPEVNYIMDVCASRTEDILRVLKLRCNEDYLMTSHGYTVLSQMIHAHRQTLRGLVLDTAVDNNGALNIAQTLGRNSNLKALCLGTLDCQDKTKRDGLVSLISEVLKNDPQQKAAAAAAAEEGQNSLEYLSLVCQELDDQGVHQIGQALSQSSLRELILFLDNESDNTISSQGVAALARVLQVNKTIQNFSLICNSLDDEGLMALAHVLKDDNRTLKNLKLKCSKGLEVSAHGYQALIDMLKSNTVLEGIELSHGEGAESADDDDDDDDEEEEDEDVNDDDDEVEAMDCVEVHEDYQSEIEFYLKLNQARVRSIHLNIDTTPVQFLSKLASNRNDVGTLFYMLSTNPSFMTLGTK